MVGNRGVDDAKALRSAPVTTEIGVTGLRSSGGFIREDFIRDLNGRRGRQIFEEMARNDSTCGAIIFAVRNMLRSLEWSVAPSDPNDARAVEAAELIEGMLFEDMAQTWPEFVDSAASMFTYGFSVHEIVFKRRKGYKPHEPWESSDFNDGLYGVKVLAPRSQKTIDRWIFDEDERLVGFEQMPYDRASVVIPITRCLHFRTTTDLDNPEGQSLLRSAYRSWYWLKRLQEIEGIGSERDLAGYPVLKVPGAMLDPDASTDQLRAKSLYEDFLRRVRRDQNEGVLIPSDRDENGNPFYEFSLMSSGGSRQIQIDPSIRRYQMDISRSVLADFIFLGSDGGGSLALGQTKVQFFLEALKGYASHIAAQINEKLIPKIWALNGLDDEIMPTMNPGSIERPDLQAAAAYIKALSDVGFDLGSDMELENHLRQMGDLPAAPDRAEDDDFFAMPSGRAVPRGALPPDAEGAIPAEPAEPAVATTADPDEDNVEKAARELQERIGLALGPATEPDTPAFDFQSVLKGFGDE